MKIWERVIEARSRKETVVCEEQFGFMPGRGTTDATHALRRIVERHGELQADLHMAFIDLEKAYDRVPRDEIWRSIREQCVPEKHVRVVKEMYRGAMRQVRSSVGMTKEFLVKVWLHQGSALSPYIFDLIMDVLVKDVKKEAPWNMMFADYVVLCEQSIDELEEKLEDWRKALEERGMKICRTKSEYLALKDVQMRSCKIQDDELKSVCKFKYLGSYIQRDGGLESKIQHRKNYGWNNWRKIIGMLCDKKVSTGLKGKVYKSVVRPGMIYGGRDVANHSSPGKEDGSGGNEDSEVNVWGKKEGQD
ncbi:uncharacterized protein LOC124545998 [Schistocerca americana]|uniref:uncharacterized protein LOC124545998 n=1 Tax=Schistocerca americana TaxID=7009 RepID=UPI001F4F1CC0|nr:uncharacterized protein LOC124545998 [Schistocerca americana]